MVTAAKFGVMHNGGGYLVYDRYSMVFGYFRDGGEYGHGFPEQPVNKVRITG
jgi:hypothetical protein